ncbi:MAG: helix-turn-helix domain-containing protein [candidate division Zixibacteria bacterium]|nr:helix-turn-helix domain-containing protein [candidate division Zixibacteria bacterium]
MIGKIVHNALKLKEILTKLANRKGVSLPEISQETGISLQVLYNIRDGKTRRPQGRTIRRLADYFGITPAQLLGEEPLGIPNAETLSEVKHPDRAIEHPDLRLVQEYAKYLTEWFLAWVDSRKKYAEGIAVDSGDVEPQAIESPPAETVLPELPEYLLPFRDLLIHKYVTQRNDLTIGVTDINKKTLERIIALLLQFDMSEYFERRGKEYEVEKKNRTEDGELD